MLLRVLCAILIGVGGVVMAIASHRFRVYLMEAQAESYEPRPRNSLLQKLLLGMMYLFIFGYGVGMLDVLLRPVQPIFLFVGLMFFLGALYVAALVRGLTDMTDSLRRKTMEVMKAFINSMEIRDLYTQGHSWHVYYIVRTLYAYLPEELRGQLNLPKLLDAALLHDVGKIGIDNAILNKRGALDDVEWAMMRQHPALGERIIADTCFAEIGDWVRYHHERMDGHGYEGLPAEKIPLEARIIAVADTYSAITTDREYRAKRTHGEAVAELQRVAGSQLDAVLVACFAHMPESAIEKEMAKGYEDD